VTAHWLAARGWFAVVGPVRRGTEALFRAAARRHLRRLDATDNSRAQIRTLLGLVHKARGTRFGRAHDFARIRTLDDYRRLVPVRTAPALWRDYWHPAFPKLDGVTWPGPLPLVAEPAAAEPLPPVALAAELCAARGAAVRTAVALAAHARPRARLLAGTLLFLGGEATVTAVGPGARLGHAEALTAQGVPRMLRPYARVTPGWGGTADGPAGTSLREVAARSASLPVTALVGPAARVARFLDLVREASGRALPRAWGGLAAVLVGGPDAPALARVRQEVGPGPVVLQTRFRPEGPVAVEDPRHGLPRLLADHGVFFEFLPAGHGGDPAGPRRALGEVEPGVVYELAVTTPAGWWSCRTGQGVVFERRDPPLVHFVPLPRPAAVTPPRAVPAAAPPPAPRPRTFDIPAAPPESFVRSLWSARADRG
jgi:hypothetical protein